MRRTRFYRCECGRALLVVNPEGWSSTPITTFDALITMSPRTVLVDGPATLPIRTNKKFTSSRRPAGNYLPFSSKPCQRFFTLSRSARPRYRNPLPSTPSPPLTPSCSCVRTPVHTQAPRPLFLLLLLRRRLARRRCIHKIANRRSSMIETSAPISDASTMPAVIPGERSEGDWPEIDEDDEEEVLVGVVVAAAGLRLVLGLGRGGGGGVGGRQLQSRERNAGCVSRRMLPRTKEMESVGSVETKAAMGFLGGWQAQLV